MALTRKQFMIVGAGAVTVAAGAIVTRSIVTGQSGTQRETQMLRSSDGVLDVELTVGITKVIIDGHEVTAKTYNQSLPGPRLVVSPGDKLRVKLTNELSESTNLHLHGPRVSPDGIADNMMIEVKPRESFQYEFDIPDDQPLGAFWYHPHLHGSVANQVFAGLYGSIQVVEDSNAELPRLLQISDIGFDTGGTILEPNMMDLMMGREGAYLLTNGQFQPIYNDLKNEETWQIVNSCTSRYLALHLGGDEFEVLGFDGYLRAKSERKTKVELAPGARVELRINSDKARKLMFDSVAHPDMMGMGTHFHNFVLARFNGTAEPTTASPTPVLQSDLRDEGVVAKRKFELSSPGMDSGMGMGMSMDFTINGLAFDMNRIDVDAKLGTVEEWTITNKNNMSHPFHLHTWPMQVISVDSKAVTEIDYRDVVSIPPLGSAVVRVKFDRNPGTTVFHCHILDHEDQGMMGLIRVS